MFRKIIVILNVLCLSSCMVIMPLKIVNDEQNLEFSVEKGGLVFKQYRNINLLIVSESIGQKWSEELQVWYIHASSGGERLRSIKYGVLPANFEEKAKPISLIKGREYTVDLVGPGYTSTGKFTY